MRKLALAANLVIASMLMASQAAAQETKQDTKQETKTAKERSSRKWFDEQRVNNCRVPAELRGSTARPGCVGEQASASVSR